ncbi:alpha/beta fold hydrolase [Streptomyces sp. NPDC006879]|uniref:alpha/beta fold hydrolase n=1 Tax=Streptomyces sp. NPDC006879 TaxID=3364767 RepID=UPI00368BEB1B
MSGQRAARFVPVDGVALHVVVEGSGPPCVLTGGLGLSWFDWDPVVPLLRPHRTVVRFDRPGQGLSAAPVERSTLAVEAQRIAGLLGVLGLADRPATVAGHSLAGFHAEAFARMHPALAGGLVLLDSSVEEHPRAPASPALREAGARALGALLSGVGAPAALGPVARRACVRAARSGAAPDPAPRSLVRRVYRSSRVTRGVLLENARYPHLAAELQELRSRRPLPAGRTVTVLAAAARRTGAAGRWLDRQRRLADRLGAHFEAAVPCGHLLMVDRPDQVARAVLGALGGEPSPP